MTAIKACFCSSAFQDDRYGAQWRVHNASKEGWRCTVCGKAKESREAVQVATADKDGMRR